MSKKRIDYPYNTSLRLGDKDIERLNAIKERTGIKKQTKAIREAIKFYNAYLKLKEELDK